MSKILSWGQCEVYARQYTSTGAKGSTWVHFDTPADGTTSLETTAGDKTEAKVEGGENEAVRRSKNTYALSFDQRVGANHTYKIADVDGIVDGEWEVVLAPIESSNAPALYIAKATASASDSYTSADGTKITYTFDALKNGVTIKDKSSNAVEIGQITWGTATLASGNASPSTFIAYKDDKTSGTDLLAATSAS